jgi:DNA-binding Lrp family transcriptional regulator
LEATRRALEDSLKNEYPPPSLKDLSLRLNRTAGTLRYQFPKLCSLIVKKYRQYSKKIKREFYRKIERALRKALKSNFIAPTLEDLVREFGCHRSVFTSNCPDLCEALRRRNEEDRKNTLAETEKELLAALAETPPRSFKEFCRRTGQSDQRLREIFPELCARISARYSSYRSESFRVRREGQAHLVRDVAYALHKEGVYPTVKNVQSRINSFSVRSCEIALTALRQVRWELQSRAVKAA